MGKIMKKYFTILVTALLTFSACSASTTSDMDTKSVAEKSTVVGLTYIPDIQFFPIYVAQEQGYFAKQGINVSIRHHGAQESLFGALENGTEDIVFAGGDEMLQANSAGIPVVNWATMYQQYPVTLIVPENSTIKSWADLTGKKVGIPGPYGENYYALLAGIKKYQLNNQVEVQHIGYTQTTALATQKVDAVVGFKNNDVVTLNQAGIKVRSIPVSFTGEEPLVGVGFGSLQNSLKDNTKVATYTRFLVAIEEAVKFASTHEAETLDIASKYVSSLKDTKQREVARKVLAETLKLYTPNKPNMKFGEQDISKWNNMYDFLQEANLLEGKISPEVTYSNKVLKQRNKILKIS